MHAGHGAVDVANSNKRLSLTSLVAHYSKSIERSVA